MESGDPPGNEGDGSSRPLIHTLTISSYKTSNESQLIDPLVNNFSIYVKIICNETSEGRVADILGR